MMDSLWMMFLVSGSLLLGNRLFVKPFGDSFGDLELEVESMQEPF